MDSLDGPKDRKPRSVKRIYSELKNIMATLPKDRQAAGKRILQMGSLVLDLRQAITDSGLTHYAIGKAAGVQPNMLDRFMSGERDLRLATAGKIADALGYRLVGPKKKAATKTKQPKG